MEDKPKLSTDIKPYCKVFNTFIEIGCGNGFMAFEFEDLGFKNIIGIDTDLRFSPPSQYAKFKSRKLTAEDLENRKEFEKKFSFYRKDYNDYDYEQQRYSFILMHHFLHFIPDDEKYTLIRRLYNLLEKDGILYIRLNHIKNADNTDPERMRLVGHNTYEPIRKGFKIKRYLVDSDVFLKEMEGYPKIDEISKVDEKAVTVVLRKP